MRAGHLHARTLAACSWRYRLRLSPPPLRARSVTSSDVFGAALCKALMRICTCRVVTPICGTDCHHLEQSHLRHLPRLYLAILGGEDDPLICRFFAPANQRAVAIKTACRRCEMCCQQSTQHQCCGGAQCVTLHQRARPSTRQWRSPRCLFDETLNLAMILMRRRPRESLHRLRGCPQLLAPHAVRYKTCQRCGCKRIQ